MSERIRRLDVGAALRYMADEDEDGNRWVVELGVEDGGFQASLIQGWGTDPLAAALDAAEHAYATVLHLQGVTITGRDRAGKMSINYQTPAEAVL